MSPKNDQKYQTAGEFLQHKCPFLDHKKRDKIDVYQGGGGGAGRPAGRRFDFLSLCRFGNNTLRV